MWPELDMVAHTPTAELEEVLHRRKRKRTTEGDDSDNEDDVQCGSNGTTMNRGNITSKLNDTDGGDNSNNGDHDKYSWVRRMISKPEGKCSHMNNMTGQKGFDKDDILSALDIDSKKWVVYMICMVHHFSYSCTYMLL